MKLIYEIYEINYEIEIKLYQDFINLDALLFRLITILSVRVARCHEELEQLEQVWAVGREVRGCQGEWGAMRWVKLPAEAVEEETAAHRALLDELAEDAQGFDITRGLYESVLRMQARYASL